MSGLCFESLADLPPKMRQQAAAQLLKRGANPVAGVTCRNPEKTHVHKYHNQPTMADGLKFDSKKEARRFLALKNAVMEGAITDLRLQRNFTLQEGFTTPDGERHRAIIYKADFTYKVCLPMNHWPCCVSMEDMEFWSEVADTCGTGTMVVEDVKSTGTRTKDYRMKKKLMADLGYQIREV